MERLSSDRRANTGLERTRIRHGSEVRSEPLLGKDGGGQ